MPKQHVKVAMFKLGEVHIELLEGTSPESAITKFIQKRGEGVHHIALAYDDVGEAGRHFASKNIPTIYPEPEDLGTRLVNFIHPKYVHGLLLELIKRKG